MKQVAEALKRLRPDYRWDEEFIQSILNHDEDLWEDDILAVLNAIIEVCDTKSLSIKWNERSGRHPWEPGKRYMWEHDVTGERFMDSFPLTKTYPQFAGKWVDGLFGGNVFETCGVEFNTETTIRGIGYKAVLAFDLSGNGIVFC